MKPLYTQAMTAIGKQYVRDHASQTVKATRSSVRTFTGFLKENYGLERIENIKPHMIEKYMSERSQVVGSAQLTRDATALRLIADSVGKSNIVPSNKELGIERTTSDRMKPVLANHEKLEEVRQALVERADKFQTPEDKALLASFDLRTSFGLRANEGLMSRAENTPEGLKLICEGTKGGRPRELSPKTEAQRVALEKQVAVASEIGNIHGRLIPPSMTARQMYDYQKNAMHNLGATKANNAHMHSVRHNHIQERYAAGDPPLKITVDSGHGDIRKLGHYVIK